MAVEVVCPHCETQFHLQPEMLGKAMRCPECKDIFTVAAKEVPPPLPREVPYERIESAPAPSLILDAEPVAVPKRAVLLPPIPRAVPVAEPAVLLPAIPRAVPIAEPEVRLPAIPRAIPVSEPEVKEVDWSSAAPPLGTARLDEPPVRAESVPLDLDIPKPKRNIWPAVLAGLIVMIVVLAVAAVGKLIYDDSRKEEILAKSADDSFKERNFPEAAKQYEELLAKYPASAGVDRYRFFGALSGLQTAVNSVGMREDPTPARAKWDAFLNEYAGSPLAKTDDAGYGVDIFDAGRKLAEGYAACAENRLKNYRAELAKLSLLKSAEKTVAEARTLLPAVERYRPPEAKPLDELRAKLDSLSSDFAREYRRLDVLKPYRDLADDPVEERIAEFIAALTRAGFSDDAEAKELISAAVTKLQSLLKPVLDPVPPLTLTIKGEPPLITVAPPPGPLPSPVSADLAPEVFFATARGWLYALDADRGELLWTTRVGPAAPPLRFALPDGGSEIVLVASVLEGQAAITARNARTGEARWHQPLEAPLAGAAAMLGSRLYVPLADAAGTFVEFDVRTGERLCYFRLRQRIGAGIVRIPGTSLIGVIADARRIFLVDVAPQDANGDRVPMRLHSVLRTDHPELSLRVPPVFVGFGESGPRTMLLLQSEGTQSTKLRAIALADLPTPPADAAVPETVAVDLAAATLPGQVTFPPASDGERVAVITDVGAFGLYRTNSPGNLDGGLFALPANAMPQDTREPLPALAALSGEEGIWVFSRGQRTLLLQSFTPVSGFKLLQRGTPQPFGVPVQRVQSFTSREAAGMVMRSEQSDSLRAVLFDLNTGRIRWERTLGAIAASVPITAKDATLLIDTDGGVQKLIAHAGDAAISERLAPPLVPTNGPAIVAESADGAWILIPLANAKVQIRRVQAGKLALDLEAALPAAFAGRPIALGDTVVMPLADGFLHRFDALAKSFVAGPMWRSGAAGNATCYLVANGSDALIASDGGRRIGVWRWPGSGDWSAVGAGIELREKVAFAPLMLRGQWLLAADVAGTILLVDLEKPSEPLRRWRPVDALKPPLPGGRPTLGFAKLGDNVIYCVDGKHLVAIAPGEAAPAWIISREAGEYDILDMIVRDNVLIVTDLAGTVSAYSAEGKLVGRVAPQSRDLLPRTAVVPFGDRLMMPTTDGSVIFLPGFRKAAP